MELDLEMSPIQPAPGHKFMLDTLLNHFLDCGQKIQKLQNNWLAIERKNEHISEEEFYHLLRETKLGPAIQGLAEMKYLARATNAKIRQSYTYARESLTELGIIETHRTLQCVNTFVKNINICFVHYNLFEINFLAIFLSEISYPVRYY